MNKYLKELERTIDTLLVENKNKIEFNKVNNYDCELLEERRKDLKNYKQVLLKAQKEHKALEIIKGKRVNVDLFRNNFVDNGFGYHYYLEKWYKYQSTDKQKLTEEEFNLLIEVLK